MRDDSAHSRPYRMRHATMLLALMVFCVLTLGLTACDGEATYTPPPPTTIGREENVVKETPAAGISTPAQVHGETPVSARSATPPPPPSETPEGYPAPPTPEPGTPVPYPVATTSS